MKEVSGGPEGNSRQFYIRDAQGNTLALYKDRTTYLVWSEQHLYGSSRLGIWNYGRSVPAAPTAVMQDSMSIGSTAYELTNHLGNVLSTISDKKIGVSSNSSTVDYYAAEVLSQNDYYPFGMGMPGRKYSNGLLYRYGFNTQEKDKEISVEGNHYTALFWEYDSRLGRRWNLDPVALADESEYVVNGNNPLVYIDPYGNFKTKFGAKVYKFFHGGDIGQAKKGENVGEWYVSKRLKNLKGKKGQGDELDEVVVGVKRTFRWNNKVGDAIDASANWVKTTDFVVEGKAKVSLGVQIGVSGNLWGIQGKVEGGVQTYDMYEVKYDITENKGYAGSSEKRVHNFFGAEGKFLSDKLRIGGKYDYTYLFYNGYYGPSMVDGTAVHDWVVNVPRKNFGPKIKIIDNLISSQMKASATIQSTNNKTFYGLDIGAGAKLILGLDLKLRIGFNK